MPSFFMGLDKKLQKLLRMGLADTKRLQYYERVMSDLNRNIQVAEYRPIILNVLEKLIKNTTNDTMIFQKTQQNLLMKNGYVKEEKKIKKPNRIPPTQRTELPQPNPSSCDLMDSGKYQTEETKMINEFMSLIKTLAREKLLTEVLGGGVAYGRSTSGAPQKPRKATKAAKASSKANTQRMMKSAEKRILDAQKNILKRRKDMNKQQQQEREFQNKQSDIQQKTKMLQ